MSAATPTEPTTQDLARTTSAADICRLKGWAPGTYLIGDEGYGPTVIEVTAVGHEKILAKRVSHNGEIDARAIESTWTLANRDWRHVAGPCSAN